MTREQEQAIKELKILKEEYWDDDGYGHETEQYDDTMLALDMAIKALEQEPCEDCVSRQAVIDLIDTCNSDGLKGIFCSYDDGKRFEKYVNDLPPVTPTQNKEQQK